MTVNKDSFQALSETEAPVLGHDGKLWPQHGFCAGASGCLLKSTPPARLLESLQEVMAGGAPMSPPVANRVLTRFRQFRPQERTGSNLSPHETRLLTMLVDGHSLKTAAAEFGVTRAAVVWHMRNIYEKLQVHSKSEAVGKALRAGLIR